MTDTVNELALLQMEVVKLKTALDIAQVERQVVQQALDEILKANIAVQTSFIVAENAKNALGAQVNELKKTVNDLMQQLAEAKKEQNNPTQLKDPAEINNSEPI